MQATQIAGDAGTPARAATRHDVSSGGDTDVADARGRHGNARLLKVGADGDLPCDSSEWATSGLFGPHAGLMAALGVKPTGTENGLRDAALADALGDRPPTGNADSSAFGSVFGNASQPALGGLGGLFSPGGGGGGGTIVVGGGTTTPPDSGTGTGTGTGTGPGTGTGTGTGGGGTGTGGGPFPPTGGPGTGGGGPGGTDSTGGTGGTGGGPGGGTTPPTGPGSGDTGGGSTGGNSTDPEIPPVPEPASWAMMLVGFGLLGGMLRRHRQVPVVNR